MRSGCSFNMKAANLATALNKRKHCVLASKAATLQHIFFLGFHQLRQFRRPRLTARDPQSGRLHECGSTGTMRCCIECREFGEADAS